MGHIRSFLYEFKNTYTVDDRLITLVFASIFLPWMISGAAIVLGALYVLVKSDVLETMRRVHGAKVLFLFSVYLLVVSLWNQNWLGALLSVGMFAMFVITIHYRRYIHKDLFSQLIDIALILSVVSVCYAIVEQFHYMSIMDGMGFLDIQNKPYHRVHTFFFNANYYAMMIVFIECMCIYKIFTIHAFTWRVYYTLIGCVNLFALFLTGGRIAWLCVGLAVLVMLLVNGWYKLFGTSVAVGALAVGVLALKPGLLPRLAAKGFAVERRIQIWQTAILIIRESWLFGRGPLTYYNVFNAYETKYIATYGMESFKQYKLGISSQHAHTLFLEPLVSFGVVGSLILLLYIVSQLKRIVYLMTRKIDASLAALLIGSLVGTLAFCIIDFPIYWIQTGFLLLLLMGSSDMYKKEFVK